MSLGNCIPGMVERGEIDAARGRRMSALFEQLETEFAKRMSPEAAAAQASEETLKQLVAQSALKKRQTMLQVSAQKRALADLGKFKGESGYAGIRAMMDGDARAPYENIVRRAEAIDFQAQADLSDFIQRHRRDFLGQPKDREGVSDVVRELHGQSTGNARSKVFADAVTDVFERLRQRFNAAGGNIGKLKGFGLTHTHDPLKVRRAGYAKWREDVLRELDTAAMRDPDTGGKLTEERLSDVLRNTYEAIRTGGLIGEAEATFAGELKLASTRADHREFVFRDGDAWMRYDAVYGTGAPFNAILGHIRGMASDIAALERFGPNPNATVRLLLDTVDRAEAASDKLRPGVVAGTSGGRERTERLWDYLQGRYNVPVLAEGWMERPSYIALKGVSGARDLLTASLLGSAPLSAISDINTQLMTRKLVGLPQTNVLAGYLRQLNPASSRDRKLAIRLGLGMRDASRALLGLSRYYGETHGPQITSVIADDVLRVSGLNKWTEAGQRAFGLDLLGELGDNRGLVFGKLPEKLRTGMERYGIDARQWEAIRTAPPERLSGAEWVNARNVQDPEASGRLMDFVLGETSAAVQESSASARSFMIAGTRPGTLQGEFLRNSFQFKSFAFSLMMQQGQRMAMLGPYRAAAYGGQFFVGMTLFGAAAIQLREIAKGRDPRPMDDEEFWADAALQGGGLGIFGDLIGSVSSDRINSLAGFALGPMYGLVNDTRSAIRTALPNERDDGTVREGNPGKAATRFAKRYTPGGNIWYLRAAYERTILDRLAEETDPDYLNSKFELEQWARDNGQEYWWAPGTEVPKRGPRLENAVRSR
ncbi:hypothetical protein [Sphingomonas qomolangmaensis]|uniref:Uncharacterized protein n=1 Tax=Sphingomonas qomolangmaensis TaxID=2918765 RepID=A0ABY5L8Z4_9SPHN|nr:hypothetical protein [Sphingomonas qomolangmaensis]UUL83454.1 hypothetical protein NMP03_04285 [Sphingomonas qomolangmaensis]